KPGETLSLSCRGSGFTFGSYHMHWIRQQENKPLVWMGFIYTDGSGTDYCKSFQGRIEITRDNSNSMVYLKLSGVTAEDTAVYYCAREAHPIKSQSALFYSNLLMFYFYEHFIHFIYSQLNIVAHLQNNFLLLLHENSFSFTGGHCVELILTGSTVSTPGQSLTLTCKLSGYSVTSTYCTVWIRQPAGKTLEWIEHICPGGDTYYIDKLKSRFQVTRDTSSNTVTLTGQNMQTEDTAVYYCAR
ncbi:hypothetical protein C0J50_11758, partial [Silurus asotus]